MGARVAWVLGGLTLLALATVAGFFCLFGFEAVQSRANVGGWLSLFLPGVLLPLALAIFCIYKAFRNRPSG